MLNNILRCLQTLPRRLARIFAAIALAEQGRFDEVRGLRGECTPARPEPMPHRRGDDTSPPINT